MTKCFCIIFSFSWSVIFVLNPIASWAGCTLSHIECRYECTEYYSNGTDCKKTKKICETICDEFDVKKSGETPHAASPSGLMKGLVAKEEAQMITVSGTLDQTYAIGGETTGWVLELDADLEIKQGMKKIKHIEVDPDGKPLDSLKGKQVKVTGPLVWRHGVERGNYPAIIIDSIKDISLR